LGLRAVWQFSLRLATGHLGSGLLQRLFQIRDQITDILDASRQPQKAIGNPNPAAFL
jgi:hypothetical protein